MKKIYLTEDNVFDIIEIGKTIRLFYDDFNQGTFDFVPYLFRSELRVPLDIINNYDSRGFNNYEVNIASVNPKYDEKIKKHIKIDNGKITFNMFWGLYLYGYDPNEFEKQADKDEFFDKMQFALYFSNARSDDDKLYLCRGSGAERVFIGETMS